MRSVRSGQPARPAARGAGGPVRLAVAVAVLAAVVAAVLGAVPAPPGPVGRTVGRVVPAAQPAAAAPDPTPNRCPIKGCKVDTTAGGYRYVYTGSGFQRVPRTQRPPGAGGVADPPACVGLQCITPATFCGLAGGVAGAGNAQVPGFNCGNANQGLQLPAVQAQLTTYLRERALPRPKVTVQPGARSFVNLPTVFSSGQPGAFALPVTVPVPATINATPRFTWRFGDGSTGPDRAGRAFTPAVSPRENPDYYVSHAYTAPGSYQVTLTVTWQGTFTVAGVGTFPLAPVVFNAVAPIVVDEAGGVLTGNG